MIVALLVGPGELLFWTTIGNGSYLGISGQWGMILLTLVLMTAGFAVLNLPIVWTLPRGARRRTAGLGDTDLWLWLLSAALSVAVGLRFFGHYCLAPPPLAMSTTGVLVRSSRARGEAHHVWRRGSQSSPPASASWSALSTRRRSTNR